LQRLLIKAQLWEDKYTGQVKIRWQRDEREITDIAYCAQDEINIITV